MENKLEEKLRQIKVRIGQKIAGVAYCADRYYNLLGWADFNKGKLYIWNHYINIDYLLQKCYDLNIDFDFTEINEKSVKLYFDNQKKALEKAIEEHKEMLKIANSNEQELKYVPKRRKYKKVKNAEQKIKKRHD